MNHFDNSWYQDIDFDDDAVVVVVVVDADDDDGVVDFGSVAELDDGECFPKQRGYHSP